MRSCLKLCAAFLTISGLGCCVLCHNQQTVPAGTAAVSSSAKPMAPGVLRLTPGNTKVEFTGATSVMKQQGSFKQMAGTLELAENREPVSVALDIDMNSTSTNIFLLSRHLKSADFFDVEKYPHASFISTKIESSPSTYTSHVITGEFTLHGVSKTVSIPATIAVASDAVTLTSNFSIKQSDFGMDKGAKSANDEVPVRVTARVPRT